MKPRSSKEKGTRLEKFISKRLEEVLGSYGVKATRMPLSGAIDRFKSDIYTNLPISFECKNVERLDFREAWRQCTQDAGSKIPILATHRNNEKDILCLINFEDLLFFFELALQTGWVSGIKKKTRSV